MTEITRIADLLEQTFEGTPYYGPSLLASLEHVDALAAARKTPNAHSIWELVMHVTAELDYSRALLQGMAEQWIEGETTWRTLPSTSAAAWDETINHLKKANRALVNTIRQLGDSILSENAPQVNRPYYVMLHGTMQHNIYHSGQIVLLSRQYRHPDA